MVEAIMRSPWAGAWVVFHVTMLELMMPAPLIAGSARRFGRWHVGLGMVLSASGIAIVAVALLAVFRMTNVGVQAWAAAALLTMLGFYLAYRFGIARNSSYGAYLHHDLVPNPRGRFRTSAEGVGEWAIGVEGIKIGVAWLGVAIRFGAAVPTMALLAGIAITLLLGLLIGRHAFHRLNPSFFYSSALLVVVLYGFMLLVAQASGYPTQSRQTAQTAAPR